MFSKSTHPGNMPIRVLQFNILKKFQIEGINNIANFKEAIDKGLVSPGLVYHMDKEPLKSPFASCESKQINIQEVFLSFMWLLSYSLYIIVEKGIQERVTKPEWKGEIIFDTDLFIKANQLFSWGLTLNAFYSDWNLDLPNPEKPNSNDEDFYSRQINSIFENSVSYILFHEFAHLALDHCEFSNTVRGKNKSELSEEERTKFIELESQADDFAFSALITGLETEQQKFHKGIAIVLAHCAMLFMVHNPKTIKQVMHPDTDIRLEKAILKLGLADPLNEDYIWTIGCFACMKFFSIHNILTSIIPKDPKPLFKDYMAEFEKIKL